MAKLKIFILNASAFLLLPISLFAQKRDISVTNDEVAYASIFAGDFSILLSILIGSIAMILVLRAARKMGGGLFGSVLNYIGTGMIFVVLGTIFWVLDNWSFGIWSSVINTVCFATGYIFMVLGANKLLKGIINT